MSDMEEKEFDYFFHKHPNETSFQSLIYVGEKRRREALDSVGLCQFSCSAQELKRKMIKLIRQRALLKFTNGLMLFSWLCLIEKPLQIRK